MKNFLCLKEKTQKRTEEKWNGVGRKVGYNEKFSQESIHKGIKRDSDVIKCVYISIWKCLVYMYGTYLHTLIT